MLLTLESDKQAAHRNPHNSSRIAETVVLRMRDRKERRGTERESFLVSSLFTKGDEQGEKKHATRNITNQKNK